ncbi:MAG: hypothetical protein WCH34_07365 [Bacteroidota bacterium]
MAPFIALQLAMISPEFKSCTNQKIRYNGEATSAEVNGKLVVAYMPNWKLKSSGWEMILF